jgi:hypothetical protein
LADEVYVRVNGEMRYMCADQCALGHTSIATMFGDNSLIVGNSWERETCSDRWPGNGRRPSHNINRPIFPPSESSGLSSRREIA